MTAGPVRGLLLAAGAGRRMGGPKALVRDASGTPFAVRAVHTLRDGGCPEVTVVVGASAPEVSALLDPLDVTVVPADRWDEGMGASLVAGLDAVAAGSETSVVVHLVDLPDVGSAVVARLLAEGGPGPAALARAAYDGRPGHPVLIGREHWAGVAATATGDQGARAYLRAHAHRLVECGDLATGVDVDTPPEV